MPEATVEAYDPDLLLTHVNEALAILDALDEGALLSEPPCGTEARKRHQCAVVLVDVLREKLERMRAQLDGDPPGLPPQEPQDRPGA